MGEDVDQGAESGTDRVTLFLQVGLTVGAVLLAVGHLVFPEVEIDGITVALLVIAVSPWLGRLFASIKLPGGWELVYKDLKKQVEQGRKEVDKLSNRVDTVERFMFAGDVAETTQDSLRGALEEFDRFLVALGLGSSAPVPRIQIGTSSDRDETGHPEGGAYYDPKNAKIFVGRSIARQGNLVLRDIVLHEYAKYLLVLSSPSSLGSQNVRGAAAILDPSSLRSGLTYYLPCAFHDDPCFAPRAVPGPAAAPTECWLDLNGEVTVSASNDSTTTWDVGSVWAQALWSLRHHIDATVVDRALTAAWAATRERPSPQRTGAFVDHLSGQLGAVPVRRILAARGLQ